MNLKNQLMVGAALSAALFSGAAVAASDASQALGRCLYQNASASDRDQLVQWAYVTIGKSEAAKRVQPIPAAASQKVVQDTKQVFSRLVLRACPKEAASALLSDPKNAASDALEELVGLMMRDKVKAKAAEVLNLQSGSSQAGGAAALLQGAASLLKQK